MIEVLLNDKKYQIQEDLSIEKYMKIQTNQIKYTDPTEVLALHLDVSVDELKEFPKDKIKFIESYITSQMIDNDDQRVNFTFTHDGLQYGFENDWAHLTWGQWTDLEVYSQPDKLNQSINMLMAILFRPVKSIDGLEYVLEPYNQHEVSSRAKEFLKLPVKYWFGSATFFLLISQTLLTNTKVSLELKNQTIERLMKMNKNLPKFLQAKMPQGFTSNSRIN
jgi:hypothetical protein